MIQSRNYRINFAVVTAIAIFIVLLSFCFNFVGFAMMTSAFRLRFAILFSIPLIAFQICNKKLIRNDSMYFKKFVLYLIFMCMFTFALPLLWGDSFVKGLENNLFVAFVLCSYFILHYKKVSEKTIIFSLTLIGLIVFIIQVLQQIEPSFAIFGVYNEKMIEEKGLNYDEIANIRNGLYRFKIIQQHFPYFLFCFYFSRLLLRFKWHLLFLTIIFAASTYLMMTRMFLICMAISAIMIFFALRKQIKRKAGVLILIAFLILTLINYSDTLFSDLFDSNNSDIDYSGTIRISCLPFIWNHSFENPLLFLIGHGYTSELWDWGEKYGYWYNDLGILGQVYPYGIIWVLIYFRLAYIILFKNKLVIPVYIKGYTFGLLCICFMMTSYGGSLVPTFLWCLILYISDLYLDNNKSNQKL